LRNNVVGVSFSVGHRLSSISLYPRNCDKYSARILDFHLRELGVARRAGAEIARIWTRLIQDVSGGQVGLDKNSIGAHVKNTMMDRVIAVGSPNEIGVSFLNSVRRSLVALEFLQDRAREEKIVLNNHRFDKRKW